MSTKMDSLAAVLANGTDQTQKHKVLLYLRDHGPNTRDAIATYLDLRIASVCARLNELVKGGAVVEHGSTWSIHTKRRVAVYKVA